MAHVLAVLGFKSLLVPFKPNKDLIEFCRWRAFRWHSSTEGPDFMALGYRRRDQRPREILTERDADRRSAGLGEPPGRAPAVRPEAAPLGGVR